MVVCAVGNEFCLGAGEADGVVAGFVYGHGDESDADLFAGCEEHIEFAFLGFAGDLGCESEEFVCCVGHGGYDEDDLVSLAEGTDSFSCGEVDSVCVGDAGSAEFLDDDGHGGSGWIDFAA